MMRFYSQKLNKAEAVSYDSVYLCDITHISCYFRSVGTKLINRKEFRKSSSKLRLCGKTTGNQVETMNDANEFLLMASA